MAIVSFRLNHLKVDSTRTAAQVVQYLQREAAYSPTVGYFTRTTVETAEHGDLVYRRVENLPAWAQDDVHGFFARAAQHERKVRWGTTWQLALPKELKQEEQLFLAHDFLQTHLKDHAYLWVMHNPVTKEGDTQPHIHVLFSERTHDGIQREGPAHYFKQWDRAQPTRGGCRKDPWFKQQSSAYEIRAAWCDAVNLTLEQAGHTARVHPGSLHARQIDRKPEPKVGPGKDPDKVAERARIKAERDNALEQRKAADGWEARKVKLGLTDVHAVNRDTFLAEGYARARSRQVQPWGAGPSRQQQQAQRVVRTRYEREEALAVLQAEINILERQQQRVTLPRTRQWEPGGGGSGLRVRLHEDEEERQYGRRR